MKICTKMVPLLMGLFALSACEGYRSADGIVIDKTSRQPLDSVMIEVTTASYSVYTDTSGKFDVHNRISGCVPDCKDIMIRFSKTNYKTITLTNPDTETIVELEK